MVRLCKNCGFENQDDYDFCAKCGTPLVEGLKPAQVYVYQRQEMPELNRKAVILSYIVTIFLSWSGFIFGLIFKNTTFATFTFFGFFMPFYLVQSKHPSIKKHGIIQMVISLVGVALSFYIMFRK
ncbi:MAG: zinc-ribbon domain-containing protein [Methanobrevibacter sp.]|uniref:zinc ribbon domain-containing protein n=1 Tax=Methanobrevibacter sp. TaxID=66852 RepID=UPI0025D9C56D|nr:zinc ribbon domain-containing protein [Methanobrevibacter sp.]MBQ6099545.1 zinc-ribbon domain-containing protein [Methanobrevibacter sp.]